MRLQPGLKAVLWLVATALAAPAHALSVGEPAPAFKLPSLRDTTTVSLNDYRGQVVYLDFWASWCGPCAEAFPLLEQLRTELKAQGFEVIAINVDSDAADARKFLKKYRGSFPAVGPAEDAVPSSYGVSGMPYGVVIDRQGVVRATHAGLRPSSVAALRQELQGLLAQPAQQAVTPPPASGSGKSELLLFINQ